MGPQEVKELPKEAQDEDGNLSVSDHEDVVGDEEPEPPADPDPEQENVEVEEIDDDDAAEDDEDEDLVDDDPIEEEEEEDADADDDDDETSEGGKDDESDDSDDEEEKVTYNDSFADGDDDEDDDEDDDDEEEEEEEEEGKSGGPKNKKHVYAKNKGPSVIIRPPTTGLEYKGDIDDLLRAAAQADEGETSAGNDEGGIGNLAQAAAERERCEAPQVIIKTTEEVECEVIDILDDDEEDDEEGEEEEEEEGGGGEEDEEVEEEGEGDEKIATFKAGMRSLLESTEKESRNSEHENDEIPPMKRMKNA